MVIITAAIGFFLKGVVGYQVVSFALLFVVSVLAFIYGIGLF
jgi:hypothetical protein